MYPDIRLRTGGELHQFLFSCLILILSLRIHKRWYVQNKTLTMKLDLHQFTGCSFTPTQIGFKIK